MSHNPAPSVDRIVGQKSATLAPESAILCPLPDAGLKGEAFTAQLFRTLKQEGCPLASRVDESLRFESLLVDLSATFVNLPADAVDAQIERALQRIVEFLGVQRSGFAEFSPEDKGLRVAHSYVVPGYPPFPYVIMDEQLPWYTERIRQGQVLRFTRLPDELPAEAVRERTFCLRDGLKANLTIPLCVGGLVLGVLAVGSHTGERSWSDELVQRLRLVGEIFANALTRKRADQKVRQSEQRYRELLETTHAVPWEADAPTWQIKYIGPQAVALLGFPLEEWYRPAFWVTHLHPSDRERVVRTSAEAIQRGDSYELEYRMVSVSGNTVWIHDLVSVVLEGENGRTVRGLRIDITARKTAEEEALRLREQLSRVARITTMGELSAAIAHEINQPLCAIVTNAQAAQRLLGAGIADLAEVRETLQDIVADSKRASEVIARIRTLVQKRQSERAPFDLHDAIREVIVFVDGQLRRNRIGVSLHLATDLASVCGDRVQLQQVVLNLLVNAIEAMSQMDNSQRELVIRSTWDGTDRVTVSVHDTGPGIASEHVDRLFDAFFTTKQGGMGIGLALSRSILEAHGGRIWVSADNQPGATFHFTLPALRGSP